MVKPVAGLLPCTHPDAVAHYDHLICSRCGWFKPDVTARRGTAADPTEWFPSRDAFEHFRRTGVRAWDLMRRVGDKTRAALNQQ